MIAFPYLKRQMTTNGHLPFHLWKSVTLKHDMPAFAYHHQPLTNIAPYCFFKEPDGLHGLS